MKLPSIPLAAPFVLLSAPAALALDPGAPSPRTKGETETLGEARASGTLDLSGARVSRAGRVSRTLSDTLDNTLDVRDFGARDDNATDSTAALQKAIDEASQKGRTLRIAPSANGVGKYRAGPLDFKNVNISREEGAGLVNLDGSPYNASFYSGFSSLPGLLTAPTRNVGRHIQQPRRDFSAFNSPGVGHESYVVYNGTTPYPYDVSFRERAYTLLGQNSATSGSWAGLSEFANIYNVSNGPGIVFTCDATNGSQYLGKCDLDPNASQTYTLADGTTRTVGNIFKPARVTMVSGNGVPPNTFIGSWQSKPNVLAMAGGTESAPVKFTGATGRHQFRVVSGRSEFNPISAQIFPIGAADAGGPKGGMNWYNEFLMSTAISKNPADQEGALYPIMASAVKTSPGNLRDVLHNGSAIISAYARPSSNGDQTYPLDDGIVVVGWSGKMPSVAAGGQALGATYGAYNGLRVGGGCSSVYCYSTSRSFFQTGINVQDYETGIVISNPAPSYTGTAIHIAPGAGNVSIGDNLVVNNAVIEAKPSTPSGPDSPCIQGQHAWDQKYEYRCVAPNRWRRIAYTSDWP